MSGIQLHMEWYMERVSVVGRRLCTSNFNQAISQNAYITKLEMLIGHGSAWFVLSRILYLHRFN